MHSLLTIFLGLMLSSICFAQGRGSDTGNGGDFTTSEVRTTHERIIVEQLLPLYDSAGDRLPSLLLSRRAEILAFLNPSREDAPTIHTVDEPISRVIDGSRRSFDGWNWTDDDGTTHIRYSIQRWNALGECGRTLLVHHEMMGLMGVEGTGRQEWTEALRPLLGVCAEEESLSTTESMPVGPPAGLQRCSLYEGTYYWWIRIDGRDDLGGYVRREQARAIMLEAVAVGLCWAEGVPIHDFVSSLAPRCNIRRGGDGVVIYRIDTAERIESFDTLDGSIGEGAIDGMRRLRREGLCR